MLNTLISPTDECHFCANWKGSIDLSQLDTIWLGRDTILELDVLN